MFQISWVCRYSLPTPFASLEYFRLSLLEQICILFVLRQVHFHRLLWYIYMIKIYTIYFYIIYKHMHILHMHICIYAFITLIIHI